MRMFERIRSKAVFHHRVADGLLALLLIGLATMGSMKIADQHPQVGTPGFLWAQAAVFSLLIFRSIWPRTVLLLTTLACAG